MAESEIDRQTATQKSEVEGEIVNQPEVTESSATNGTPAESSPTKSESNKGDQDAQDVKSAQQSQSNESEEKVQVEINQNKISTESETSELLACTLPSAQSQDTKDQNEDEKGALIEAEARAKEIAQEVVKDCYLEDVSKRVEGTQDVEQLDKGQQTEENTKLDSDKTSEMTDIPAAAQPSNGTQEVSSTNNKDEERPKSRSSSRRPSYNNGRSYAGGSYQNYGLTYLPYKSNFEPSEAARRRADEFIKTLKL